MSSADTSSAGRSGSREDATPLLVPLCRNEEQLEAAHGGRADTQHLAKARAKVRVRVGARVRVRVRARVGLGLA